ncbi:hypothetical protein ACFL6U_24815 [Planctomycetota bacterium]
MSNKIKIEEAPDDVIPKCPHCKEELRRVWLKKRGIGFLGSAEKQFIICPHCHCLLAYGAFHV